MRILILSANTGGGHNSAAKAVKDYFEQHGVECDIKDSLAYWSENKSNMISGGHVLIYKKAPRLFGVMYRFAENHRAKENATSFMYALVKRGANKLYDDLFNTKYDAIVCTHIFAGMTATAVKKKYIPNLKIYFIATDYTCSPGAQEIDADVYFIPHRLLEKEYAEQRVPRERTVASGIPVRADFYEKLSKQEAKRLLSLPEDKKLVLLMSGSMGCGPIKLLAKQLKDSLPENANLAVVCGSNKSLYKELREEQGFEDVTIVGFTDKMPVFMDAAEVVLTKPGGLSSTEALVKGLPAILINAVPGCETRNLDFLTQNGFAETAGTVSGLVSLAVAHIEDKEKNERMRKLIKEQFYDNASSVIFNKVMSDIKTAYSDDF